MLARKTKALPTYFQGECNGREMSTRTSIKVIVGLVAVMVNLKGCLLAFKESKLFRLLLRTNKISKTVARPREGGNFGEENEGTAYIFPRGSKIEERCLPELQ